MYGCVYNESVILKHARQIFTYIMSARMSDCLYTHPYVHITDDMQTQPYLSAAMRVLRAAANLCLVLTRARGRGRVCRSAMTQTHSDGRIVIPESDAKGNPVPAEEGAFPYNP